MPPTGTEQAVGASGFGGGSACYVPGVQADDYRQFGAAKLVPANSDISVRRCTTRLPARRSSIVR